jgi:hypothetical protein
VVAEKRGRHLQLLNLINFCVSLSTQSLVLRHSESAVAVVVRSEDQPLAGLRAVSKHELQELNKCKEASTVVENSLI